MRSIGIKAEQKGLHWAIIEGTKNTWHVIAHAKYTFPKSLNHSQRALNLFGRITSLVEQHSPSCCAIQIGETFYKDPAIPPNGKKLAAVMGRARVEGIVIAALASKGVDVSLIQKAQLKARTGTKRIQSYIDSGQFREIDASNVPKIRRAAVAAAVSCLPSDDAAESHD